MKCYHPETFEKIGFDVVLERLANLVKGREARERVQDIQPVSDWYWLETELGRVKEFRDLLDLDDPFPALATQPVSEIFDKLKVEGNWLRAEEIFRFSGWLQAISGVRGYLKQREETYPLLNRLVNRAAFDASLVKEINKVIDARGKLKDDASPELKRVRREQSNTASDLRKTLQRILRKANQNNWSIETEVTIRNDRLVIPVRADARGRVPGFVQDISQSGGTVYVEPAESLPLNNALRELQIREQNEIIRILQVLTARIRAQAMDLQHFQETMIQVDLLHAKAKLALQLKAHLPQIVPDQPILAIQDALYPLLQFKAREEEDFHVIPLALAMDKSRRIILISGPNAGGKSVSLKTVGLLQVMLQSGFLVPVHPDSKFGIFESLFLDIGDEQSVDTDLSTYTSRLYAWRKMGDKMNSLSLFLIDEFGSGTDPKQGGAIAESFLERFVTQRAFGIITTHYGNLKDYAEITSGIANAAMQFDQKGLKPTYRLVEGMPGRSYAFEMAKRVGVHHTILKRARNKVGDDELETEQLLKELERKNQRLSQMLSENKRLQQKLDHLVNKNEQENTRLTRDKKKIMRAAQEEARRIIDQANRKVEQTIREIRENQAEKKKTQLLRAQLAASKPDLVEVGEESDQDINLQPKGKKGKKSGHSVVEKAIQALPNEIPGQGDWVKLKQSDSFGKLVDLKGKKAVVEVGEMRLSVKLGQLVKIKPPASQKERHNKTVHVIGGRVSTLVKSELDIMGKRVEEAIPMVDRFLDDARVAGLQLLRILHGKGNGILREAIRKHLLDQNDVNKVSDAPIDEGGAGWTIFQLK
ncbi:MAG: Smr/MutS family protein [Bacteroidota bacterium]